MKTRKRKPSYYLILGKLNRRRYGAFPYTIQGKKDARAWVKLLKARLKEKFIIETK